jgi:hypothetical protein
MDGWTALLGVTRLELDTWQTWSTEERERESDGRGKSEYIDDLKRQARLRAMRAMTIVVRRDTETDRSVNARQSQSDSRTPLYQLTPPCLPPSLLSSHPPRGHKVNSTLKAV